MRREAGQRCERCGAPNGEMIHRGRTRERCAVWRLERAAETDDGICAETGRIMPDTGGDAVTWGRPIRVVLTVAHLDHHPENCARGNLRAWCQRCHNTYDAPMRRAGIAARRKAERATGDLFDGADTAFADHGPLPSRSRAG